MRLQAKSQTSAELAERVRSILGTRNLTLYQVSQKSEAIYGHASPYFLPHNFYYDLKLGTFSPSVYQLFALSRISDYRPADWLHVLGFDPKRSPDCRFCFRRNAPSSWTLPSAIPMLGFLGFETSSATFPLRP